MWLNLSFCAFGILLFVKSFHIWGWEAEYTFILHALTTVVFAILKFLKFILVRACVWFVCACACVHVCGLCVRALVCVCVWFLCACTCVHVCGSCVRALICMCAHATVPLWNSEDDFGESVLSTMNLGIEVRSSGFVVSTFYSMSHLSGPL